MWNVGIGMRDTVEFIICNLRMNTRKYLDFITRKIGLRWQQPRWYVEVYDFVLPWRQSHYLNPFVLIVNWTPGTQLNDIMFKIQFYKLDVNIFHFISVCLKPLLEPRMTCTQFHNLMHENGIEVCHVISGPIVDLISARKCANLFLINVPDQDPENKHHQRVASCTWLESESLTALRAIIYSLYSLWLCSRSSIAETLCGCYIHVWQIKSSPWRFITIPPTRIDVDCFDPVLDTFSEISICSKCSYLAAAVTLNSVNTDAR